MVPYATEHLYTLQDITRVRQHLLQEQKQLCKLTGMQIERTEAVLDHNHSTQYVRGVLHRQANAVLGKIENLWTRYLGWWYNGTLGQFLRQCADYIESKPDTRYLHPGWIRRLNIDFKKLPEAKKRIVLESLGEKDAKNGIARNKQFLKAIKSKRFTFDEIGKLIKDTECTSL